MSTDRELLKLAAKAAVMTIKFFNFAGEPVIAVPGGGPESCLLRIWSPLDDDGDALRLACTLGLTVECDFHDSDTCTASQTRGEVLAEERSGMLGEIIGNPEFAATRRAIVRAAAEIGRSMP